MASIQFPEELRLPLSQLDRVTTAAATKEKRTSNKTKSALPSTLTPQNPDGFPKSAPSPIHTIAVGSLAPAVRAYLFFLFVRSSGLLSCFQSVSRLRKEGTAFAAYFLTNHAIHKPTNAVGAVFPKEKKKRNIVCYGFAFAFYFSFRSKCAVVVAKR